MGTLGYSVSRIATLKLHAKAMWRYHMEGWREDWRERRRQKGRGKGKGGEESEMPKEPQLFQSLVLNLPTQLTDKVWELKTLRAHSFKCLSCNSR